MHEDTSGLDQVRAPWSLFDCDSSGTKTGPRRIFTEKIKQTHAIRAVVDGRTVVYAVQFPDGVVKIGCSTNLAQRIRFFRARGGEVVGFMFGEYEDEQVIHASLKPHRARGREYYHPTPAVLAVVNGMRDAFNLPHIAA